MARQSQDYWAVAVVAAVDASSAADFGTWQRALPFCRPYRVMASRCRALDTTIGLTGMTGNVL
jgi:hypothetical protein